MLAITCAVPALGAGAPPPLPAAFWGSVRYDDGSPVAEGTVEAVAEDVVAGSVAVRNGQYGGPGGLDVKLVVPGTEDTAGQTVGFRVNGVEAAQTAAWQSGGVTRVDLTVPNPEPGATPNPAPGGSAPAGGGGGGSAGGAAPAPETPQPEQPTGELDRDQIINIRRQVQNGGFTPQQAVQQLTGQLAVTSRQRMTTEARRELKQTVETVMRAAGTLAAGQLQVPLGADNALVAVSAGAVTAQLEAMTGIGRNLAQSLEAAGAADLAAALPRQVVIAAPAGAAEKPEMVVQVPAAAVKAVAGAGANLVIDTGAVSLDLPPAALPAGALETGVVEIAARTLPGPEAAGLMQNLPSTAFEKVNLAGRVFDVGISAGGEAGAGENLAALNKPVKLVFKYDPAGAGSEPELLGIYHYNRQTGAWDYVGGRVDTAARTVTAGTRHFSLYAVMALNRSFTDTADHWARREIGIMAAKHAVTGTAPDTFSPERKITRAEFAVILSRLTGLEADPAGAAAFSDLKPGAWYRGMVGAAVRAGLAAGTGAGRFEPGAPVTREQAATMLGRALGVSGGAQAAAGASALAVLEAYRDAGTVSSWARDGVARAIETGLMRGRTGDEFVPAGNCTRAEAAVVFYRLFQKLD